MGRKLPAQQLGVFPGHPEGERRHEEKERVIRRMLAQRAGLPKPESNPYGNLGNRELNVFDKKREIMDALRDHQIIALEGATGSGKSTQLPQYALEMGYKKVIHLVPRILIANNLGDQLQRELVNQLGEEAASMVGVHHSERSDNLNAQVMVMTPGTFMRTMDQLDAYGEEPVLTIVDEVHEKDFETDMSAAVSTKKLAKHANWGVAVVSATMDAKSVDDAYGPLVADKKIPHITVEGRPHELESLAEPDLDPVETYRKHGASHERTIIFTAGKAEIRDTIEALEKACLGENVRILPLHAKLPKSETRKATHAQLSEGEKLVIVATSAAQSGITIPGLTLSIMDGTVRRPRLDLDGTEGLFKEYCTQDELIQEGGRAGRDVGGGQAILCKSNDPEFGYMPMEERELQAPAQIYSTNISRSTLLATSFGESFFDINDYLIHKVDRRKILDAYEVLWRLQAIDGHNEITDLGTQMNQMPLRPEFAKSIAEAVNGAVSIDHLRQLIAIAASIESGGLPFHDKDAPDDWMKDIQPNASDDYIAEFNMFLATRQYYHVETVTSDRNGAVASRYAYVDEALLVAKGYDPKNVLRAHRTFDKISKTLGIDTQGGEPKQVDKDEDIEELHSLLTAGLFDFAHQKSRDDKLRNTKEKQSWYKEVSRGNEKERRISNRSVLSQEGPKFTIGLPRRYEQYKDGEQKIHEIIETVMPTTVQKLAKHVMHLTESHPDKDIRLVEGRLQRNNKVFFGNIQIGTEKTGFELVHTEKTRQVLADGMFEKPTQTLSEFISIKRRLEYLSRRISSAAQHKIFPNGLLTHEWLTDKVHEAITSNVDSVYGVDNNLRAMAVREGISIRTWITKELEELVLENSPDYIYLPNDASYEIYWSQGKPIIHNFNLLDVSLLPRDGLKLSDGREVYFSHRKSGGDTKRVTAAQLIDTVTS